MNEPAKGSGPRAAVAPVAPRPSTRTWARLLLLAAAGLAANGGPLFFKLGFYHDDWILLSHMVFADEGLLGAMRGMLSAVPVQWFRPMTVPVWAALFRLSGLDPLAWHLALLLVNVLLAWAAMRILEAYGVGRLLSWLGAAAFLAYPTKDSTMFWPFIIINSLSFWLALEAFLAHLRFVETGSRGRLALSALLLLAAFATYDQPLLLSPLWLLPPGARIGRSGVSLPPRTWAGFGVAAATTGLYLAYKFIAAPMLAGGAFHQPMQLSFGRAAYVLWTGLSINFGPLLNATKLGLRVATKNALFAGAAGVFLPWLAYRFWRADEPKPDPALYWVAAGLFLLGYAPLIPSNYYITPYDHMNRIQLVPALGIVVAATALAAGRGLWAGRAAALAAGALVAAHAGFAYLWVESYRLQQMVGAMVRGQAERWPADKKLYLALPADYVGGKAPIFIAHWDITGAVRLWTGDRSRSADILTPNLLWTERGLLDRPKLVPYDTIRILDAATGELTPVDLSTRARLARYRLGKVVSADAP